MLNFHFITRQIRSSGKQALIFVLCVALSLLTLVSLGGFSSSVRSSMLKDARQLHAADIIIHSHYPLSPGLDAAIKDYEKQGLAAGALITLLGTDRLFFLHPIYPAHPCSTKSISATMLIRS